MRKQSEVVYVGLRATPIEEKVIRVKVLREPVPEKEWIWVKTYPATSLQNCEPMADVRARLRLQADRALRDFRTKYNLLRDVDGMRELLDAIDKHLGGE